MACRGINNYCDDKKWGNLGVKIRATTYLHRKITWTLFVSSLKQTNKQKIHFMICLSAQKNSKPITACDNCDCKTRKVNGQLTYMGCILVLQALCTGLVQYNNQPWCHEDALFVLNWPTTASLETWCVLRLGTTGCVHLCVSLRLEIRFGFKSAQICGLLLLHRGSLSLAPGSQPPQCNNAESFLHEEYILVFDLCTWTAAVRFIWLSCACTVLEAAMLGHGQPLLSLHSLRCTQRPLDTPFSSFNHWNYPDEIIQFSHFPSLISCWPSQWRLQSVPIWSRISRNRENFVIKACWN